MMYTMKSYDNYDYIIFMDDNGFIIQLYLGIVDTFVALAGLATRLKLPAYGWLVSRAFIFTFAKPTNRFLVGLSTIPRVHYSEVQL